MRWLRPVLTAALLAGLAQEAVAQNAVVSVALVSSTTGETSSSFGVFQTGTSPVRGSVPYRLCFTSSLGNLNSLNVERRFGQTPFGLIVNGCLDESTGSSGAGNAYSVGVVLDTLDEPDEVVTATLSEDPDNALPDGVTISTTANTATFTVRDDDPTVVSLAKVSSATSINEGGKVEFTVTLGRALIAGETIDVPLSISGTGVTTGDWSLAKKSGGSLNTGVTLQDTGTATPKVRFSGAGAQTATLELTATADGTAEGSETINVALGPDGAGTNGFDHTSLGTNVGGGADPHNTNNDFDIMITPPDTTAPRVTSITRQSPSSSPTDADSLTWRVLFNEAVQNVNGADFQVSGTSASLVAAQVGATNAYDVTASGGNLANLDATVTLSFTNGQNIQDTSGNALTNTTPTGTNHNTFVVNNTPTLSLSLASSSGAEGNSGSRDVDVNVSLNPLPSAAAFIKLCVKNTGSATFRTAQGNRAKDFDLLNTGSTPLGLDSSNCTIAFQLGGITNRLGRLRIFGDTTPEGNETAVLELRRSTRTPADVVISPTAGTATYTITNDDGTPPVITISGGAAVTEGTGASFTVNANPAPAANLDVTVAVTQSGDFVTNSNRGAKTVTINANATSKAYTVPTVNDMIDEANGSVTVTVNNGEGYTVGSTAAATVTVNDNDTAAVIVSESGGTSVTEAAGAGRTDSYTVVLATRPTHSVTITPTSATPAAATVSPATLTFTNSNWSAPQTVTVTGVDDNVDQTGNRSATISHSATSTDANYNNISIANVTATVVDNDTAAVNISTATVSVTEASGAGRTDSYTVVLATRPTHSVTITPTSATPAAATVSPGTLTFTTSNWNTAKTVTVTGVDDNVDQTGNRSATISHSATSTDANYNNISIANVTATVVDNDTAAVNISTATVSVTEASGAGRTDTYTVVLATRPTHDVTITSTSATPAAATVSPGTLTFTTSNWNTAQTVTVTGVDDNVDQTGNRSATISHSATSTDGKYNSISIANVTATVVDNDGAGVTINETGTPMETRVTEAGSGNTDTYTVVLDTQPTHSVTITPTSDTPAAATVSPGTLTFTTGNWNTAQTVTVTGVDDSRDNPGGGREVSISHGASSTDDKYTIASGGTVGVTVSDDDATTVTLSGTAGDMEEGESQTFTITLGRGLVDGETLTAPLTFGGTATRGTDYTMTGTSATGVEYNNLSSVNARVVFTGPQTGATATMATITLRATADSTVESDPETVEIGLGSITNTGLTGAGGVSETDNLAPFAIADADGSSAGVSITESGGSTSVTEAAGPTNTDTYTVVLKSQPTATVTIEVTSGDPGAATVSPATLTFTSGNWDNDQMVTVTGVDDSVPQSGGRSVAISHSATSTDPKYNGNTISIPNVTATVVDDDNTAPSALPAVEFTAAAYSGGEASGSRTINVALSATPAFTAATTVSYRVSGTATAGEDFTPLPGTVSMTGGAGTIPITILEDQMADDSETIILTLIAANGYTVGTQGSTTITITDDDGATPPPSTLPVVSIAGGGGVINEGEEASFTVTATPVLPPGATITVNVRISDSGDFASSGQTGSRSVTIDASGTASFTVTTEDDTTQEEDGRITATVQRGPGYTPHDTTASASVTVADDEVVRLSTPRLRVAAGGSASYQVALDDRPTGDVTVTIRVDGVNGEGGAALSPNLSPPGNSPLGGANTTEGGAAIRVHPATLTFTPANWDRQQPVTLTVAEEGDLMGAAITLTHTANGGGHVDVSTTMTLTVVAAHSTEEAKAWHLRLGRNLSHQVVDALQERWSASPATGLQLTVAGEPIPSATALAEHEGLLTKVLGFEMVTPQALVEGSSFSVAPEPEGAAPRLAFWGQGAFSSFSGEQETLSLDGEVTTLLLGADWHTERWQAGAALSHSWGSGSYGGDNGADGEITSTVTGLFPYGRYALNPRLGLWAVAGHGWGQLSLKPDGKDEAKPNTTLGMAAVGLDGVLLHGGREGITLTTTADVLTLKTTSAEGDGLDSSEGSLSRRRVGLEAVRPFPLSSGASLLPSMALGIRHDSGDAEAGYGLDLGAAIRWQAPQQGISGELKGHTLLTHTEESLQDQGLALSFSWQPHPSNRGPSLSLSHAMGATAAGGMDTLLHPTTMEGLDAEPGNGQRLTAELAYGFPAHNDHITLTPALALAFSPTSRNYGLLWSVAPYPELQGEPWELSLAGERQEQNTATSPVEHSLKLRFSLLF